MKMKWLFLVLSMIMFCGIVYSENESVSIPINQAKVIQTAIDKGAEQVIKVGENHGKVQKILKDVNGENVVIAEFDFGNTYVCENINRIDTLIAQFKDPVWIQKQIDNLEAQKTKLTEMKNVLEGE